MANSGLDAIDVEPPFIQLPIDLDQQEEPLDDALIDIQSLFSKSMEQRTAVTVREFVQKARLISLPLSELERYLAALEQGQIVSTSEKYKILFLQAATLEKEEVAEEYLQKGQFDTKKMTLELLSAQNSSRSAIQLLTKNGLQLDKDDVALPHLFYLLTLGIDVNLIQIDGKSLLLWALQSNNESLIDTVTHLKARPCQNFFCDASVKVYFATKTATDAETVTTTMILQELRQLGIDLNATLETIVTHAVGTDDDEAISYLHAAGLDPTLPFRDTSTPLHAALEQNRLKAAKALLALKPNLFAANKEGITPFHLMLKHPSSEIRALLASRPACSLADLARALKTVTAGTEELFPFIDGSIKDLPVDAFYTLEGIELFSALFRLGNGASKLVRSVIAKGYDVFSTRDNGPSPFNKLIEEKNVLAILMLINSGGIKPDQKLSDGTSLLSWIVGQPGSRDYLSRIIKFVQSFDERGKDGETLLHLAVTVENPGHVKTLLGQRKIDVNALDAHGRPALYYALKPCKKEIVGLLLQNGALPFHLADRLVDYSNYVFANNFQQVIATTRHWNMFTEAKQDSFFDFFRSMTYSQSDVALRQEALEIALLIPHIRQNCTPVFTSKADFLDALIQLSKKYPQAPIEHFYAFMTQLDRTHMQRHLVDFTPLPLAISLDIQQLLHEFDTLNWNDPDAPYYCDPSQVRVMGKFYQKEELRGALHLFLQQPLAQELDLLLQQLLQELQQKRAAKQTTKICLKLACIAHVAPKQFEESAFRLYQKLKFKKTSLTLLEERFDAALADFRACLAKRLSDNRQRAYSQVIGDIGQEFNFPDIVEATNEANVRANDQQISVQTKNDFLHEYSPQFLIPFTSNFFATCKENLDGTLAKWFKTHMPETFFSAHAKDCSWSSACIDLFCTTEEEKQMMLQEIFRQKGIHLPKDVSAAEALKKFREQEFLTSFVFDKEKKTLRPEAIVFFLKKRQVLTEFDAELVTDFYKKRA